MPAFPILYHLSNRRSCSQQKIGLTSESVWELQLQKELSTLRGLIIFGLLKIAC